MRRQWEYKRISDGGRRKSDVLLCGTAIGTGGFRSGVQEMTWDAGNGPVRPEAVQGADGG